MPASNFAIALMDTIVRGPVAIASGEKSPPPGGEITCDSLRAAVTNSTTLNASMQRVMLLMLDSAHGDVAKAQANIETWFNSGMERVSGWYKRQTQWVLLVLGFFIAVALNVDSLKVADELYRNDNLRAGAVAQAGVVTKDGKLSADLAKNATATLDKLKLPIGWQGYKRVPASCESVQELWCIVSSSFFGWLLTAFAISFGAPFWFDLLNKLISVRSTLKPQAKTPPPPTVPGGHSQTATTAASPGNAGPPVAVPDVAVFKPHEWTSGDDPQGGVL
jgi:hypothetical protein